MMFGSREVGEGCPVFMIAEIGINHNGSMEIAKKLMDATHGCGWHCAKFQKRTPELCVPEKQKNVERETPWGKITYLEYRHRVEFSEEQYNYIDQYCREKPLLWAASVWDLPSLALIGRFNVPFIKLPSAKLCEVDLLKAACEYKLPIMLSTGMSSLEEVDRSVNLLEKLTKGDYVLMHTNSTYPTPSEELNLRMIQTLRDRYHCAVGYSGHEYGLEPTSIAVTLGARIVERHVTLSHSMWGSDQSASLEVHAMDMLYKRIENIDVMIGDGLKRVSEGEIQIRNKLRG